MNTIELMGIMKKCVKKNSNFLGVLPSDRIPKQVSKFPALVIINTHPSTKPGEHWVAVYINSRKHGYFFDSFGNPPEYKHFPVQINKFIAKNCRTVSYSARQVQSNISMVCGQHCIFFLCNIQRGVSYQKFLNMYSSKLPHNDAMVCHFVKQIQPAIVCEKYAFTCVQCVKNKRR